MYNIVFLSSFHIETGKCSSAELYNLIEKLQPEVIFEELPIDIFEAIYYFDNSPQSLEARAVKKYITTYPIKHFPVDTNDTNLLELFEGYDLISERNPEYHNLF